MQTGTELRGLAAIRATEGVRLGRIGDVVFDAKSGQVAGFALDEAQDPGSDYLPAALVQKLGVDAAMVGDSGPLPDRETEAVRSGLVSARALAGRPVINEAGTAIGRVADVQVDTDALSISALMLSTGLLDNVLNRQSAVPFALVRAIGVDSIVVSGDYDPGASAPEEEPPAAVTPAADTPPTAADRIF